MRWKVGGVGIAHDTILSIDSLIKKKVLLYYLCGIESSWKNVLLYYLHGIESYRLTNTIFFMLNLAENCPPIFFIIFGSEGHLPLVSLSIFHIPLSIITFYEIINRKQKSIFHDHFLRNNQENFKKWKQVVPTSWLSIYHISWTNQSHYYNAKTIFKDRQKFIVIAHQKFDHGWGWT